MIAGALAYWGLSAWAPLVTIASATLTAYVEFSGTSSKIIRYSECVQSLEALYAWWQTLQEMDALDADKIDRLISSCEEVIQQELRAWNSTSRSSEMLRKASSDSQSQKIEDSRF